MISAKVCTQQLCCRPLGLTHASRLISRCAAPHEGLLGFNHHQRRRRLQKHSSFGPSTGTIDLSPEPVALEDEGPDVAEVKAQLLDSMFGINRGLDASSEVRAEINELITQLEVKNPTPNPNEAAELLNGEWKLVYTSNSELMGLLALGKLPFVTVGDITQTINSATLSVENKVQLTVPFARTALTANASFEVRSPKRVQVKFERGAVATPHLLMDVEIPASVSVLGQPVDLSNLKEALDPVNASVRDALARVSGLISRQPDLSFPILSDRAQTWLLNTFLDEDTRISRGDGGSVFVLVKDVSLTSAPPVNAIVAESLVAELSDERLTDMPVD